MIFKEILSKFKDKSRTNCTFLEFQEFSRTKVIFKDFSRSVRTCFICITKYKNEAVNCIHKYIIQIGFRRKSSDFYKSVS